MDIFKLRRVFYRAPILFSPGPNFGGKRDDPIKVTAIQAIEFFNHIEITQVASVKNDMIRAPYLGNTKQWKTQHLIKADNTVHDEGGQ